MCLEVAHYLWYIVNISITEQSREATRVHVVHDEIMAVSPLNSSGISP